MRYQKIHAQIWQDEKFITLSQDAKYLFLYILTSPHSNAVGLYVLPKPYICADLKWDTKRLGKPFKELLDKHVILYDETVNLVCIKNHLKHNPIENENQAKAASKLVMCLPKSTMYLTILEQLTQRYHEPLLEQLRERYAQPETGTGTGTGTGTELLPPNNQESFETFWQAYPKKKSKGDAEKAWNKAKVSNGLFEKIMTKLEILKGSFDWMKENGKYIPHPATWLNAKGWEDEPSERFNPVVSDSTLGMMDWARRKEMEAEDDQA